MPILQRHKDAYHPVFPGNSNTPKDYCLKFSCWLVPGVGLEPTCLTASGFKSDAATNYANRGVRSLSYSGFFLGTLVVDRLDAQVRARLGADQDAPGDPVAFPGLMIDLPGLILLSGLDFLDHGVEKGISHGGGALK